MPMENDNGHASNVVVTAEQATKINETDVEVPANRQSGVVSDAGSESEKGEEEMETAVAVAVAVDEGGSNLVGELPPRSSSARVPFTNLSQIDADLALARTLQEQERAYMMLTRNSEISDYGSWETGSFVYDEDEFDDPENEYDDEDEDEYETDDDPQEDAPAPNVHTHEDRQEDGGRDPDTGEIAYADDEAYARALQEAEETGMVLAARLSALTGLTDRVEVLEDESHTSQDAWDEMDPDELSYEELLALGEFVGTESRGLSADTIALLPSKRYKDGDNQNGTNESCVICRLDYEENDDLILLPCKHSYHSECINNWLKINKVCPVCSAEVSASSSGQS